MINEACVGLRVSQDYTYDWRDVILYHLGIGAGQKDLEYIYEKDLKMLPTFGVVPCFATFGTKPHYDRPYLPTSLMEGLRPEGTLHMDHRLVIHRPADPQGGNWHVEKQVSRVYDRGKDRGAKIMIEVQVSDRVGPVFTNTIGYFNRYAGGFGGQQPPSPGTDIPRRTPDRVLSASYGELANAVYRLTGDTHRLHIDPEFAGKSGFDRCIVHGLCSMGYGCRMLVGMLIPHRPERMKEMEVQFRSVAYPGERFCLELWQTGETEAVFRTVSEQTGKAILDRGRFVWE